MPVEDQQRQADDDDAEIVVVDRLEEIDAQTTELDIRKAGDAFDAFRAAEGIGEAFPDQPDDLAGGEGADQKVETLHAEQREAQDEGD